MNLVQFDGHTPGPWDADYDPYVATLDEGDSTDVLTIRVPTSEDDEVAWTNQHLAAAAPDLLAEVKRWREECEAQQAYARALHAQLARATEWAYQQFCYDKSKMEHFDNHVWGEENAP